MGHYRPSAAQANHATHEEISRLLYLTMRCVIFRSVHQRRQRDRCTCPLLWERAFRHQKYSGQLDLQPQQVGRLCHPQAAKLTFRQADELRLQGRGHAGRRLSWGCRKHALNVPQGAAAAAAAAAAVSAIGSNVAASAFAAAEAAAAAVESPQTNLCPGSVVRQEASAWTGRGGAECPETAQG